MRRHRVLELEEVPENTFLCASEGCHIGAGSCATKHRYERDDQQLTQIMSGVLGAVVGDFLKGGQEQMHGSDGAPKGRVHRQNRFPRQPQAMPFSAAPSNAIPLLNNVVKASYSFWLAVAKHGWVVSVSKKGKCRPEVEEVRECDDAGYRNRNAEQPVELAQKHSEN